MDKILGLVRHVLTFGGGYLVAKDVIPAEALDQVVGAVITLIGVVASVLQKNKEK